MGATKLIGIAFKTRKRGNMETVDDVEITKKAGVGKDFRGKFGKRQITVMSQVAWLEACDELNLTLDWLARRANLLVDNMDLIDSAGKVIKIGDVSLLITGETDPCSRMDEVYSGLYDALLPNWRGGVCCQVLSEGEIAVGDSVEMKDFHDEK